MADNDNLIYCDFGIREINAGNEDLTADKMPDNLIAWEDCVTISDVIAHWCYPETQKGLKRKIQAQRNIYGDSFFTQNSEENPLIDTFNGLTGDQDVTELIIDLIEYPSYAKEKARQHKALKRANLKRVAAMG